MQNNKLGHELDCLYQAIERETNPKKEKQLKKQLKNAEKQAIKYFGSIENCINESLN
jgi:hypothetical protein